MGSVILWMFLYGSPRDYVQPERFSSVEACEAFVVQVKRVPNTDFKVQGHVCFQDF